MSLFKHKIKGNESIWSERIEGRTLEEQFSRQTALKVFVLQKLPNSKILGTENENCKPHSSSDSLKVQRKGDASGKYSVATEWASEQEKQNKNNKTPSDYTMHGRC